MNQRSRTGRRPYAPWLVFALLFGAAIALAGCSIGPIDFGGGPAGTPAPPTNTVPPPSPTPAPRALSGAVLDAYTNKPIANAEVTAGGVLTATNTEGMFYYDDVPLNSKIVVQAGGYSSAEVDSGTADRVEVQLRPNTISGRVTSAQSGEALAGVLVKLVLPQAAPSQPVTPSTTITDTTAPTETVPTTQTLGYTNVLAAPVLQGSSPGATAAVTSTRAPTSTPEPPTATPTPRPIPPTGDGFVAVYTDESGNYFFRDVPEGATLTFKLPGYKLTKTDVAGTARKDVALEEHKVEAVYITAPWAASPDLMEDTLSFIEESKANNRINAVVLNVQNDASEWVYDTKNPDVLAAENTDMFLTEMPELVADLKARGLYVIARVVTFQQKTLAENKPEWAVKSDVTGEPWKGGYMAQQKWLDVTNPAVQQHIIDMTKEVLTLGFDEIQYDYVRFPSDPAPSEPGDMVYSTMPITDTGKVKVLAEFLEKVHDVIEPTDAFMSIDVFGYTLWPDRDGAPILGVIGQVIPELIDHTDYVCPMIYPSHFSPGEQGCDVPAACAYELVRKSGEYAQKLFAGHKTKYRPWVQAFDWPGGDYTSPGSQKVPDQIRAMLETGAWGWQWWDPAINYEPRNEFVKPLK
ncbi:MAG TPA: putative glycoside hydrolase [Chloroflexia bacterium]|nr:putative glycoside hydrolase [Chloroflexia bacterium]